MVIPRVSSIRIVISLAAAPLTVTALALAAIAPTPAAASNCRRLKHVKSFHGHVSFSSDATTSGKDPDSGGTEEIDLHEQFQGVAVKLHELPASTVHPELREFVGEASGGNVSVQDSFENTGTDLSGQALYGGRVSKKNGGAANLVIDRKNCRYLFAPGFHVRPTFSGDPGVNPGGLIGFSALPEYDFARDSLVLKDSQKSHLFEDSCANLTLKVSCVNLSTGWLGDYFRLQQCHSLDTSMCTLHPDDPIGHGDIHWHLRPKF
jgi:hypothetical protein